MEVYNIAVVGATGVVGKEFISILGERNFQWENSFRLQAKNR